MKKIVLLLCCAAAAGGCATASYQKAAATSSQMEETSRSLVRAGREIDDAVNSLNNLQGKSNSDLRNQYLVFVRRIKNLEAQQRRVAARQNSLEAASKTYFDSWESALKRFQGTDIKKKSRQRRQAAIDSFNTMFDSLQLEDESYRMIINDMRDIRRYLGYDLTPQSVDSIKDNIRKVNEDARAVHAKIEQAVKELMGTQTPLPAETQPLAPVPQPAPQSAPQNQTS